MKLEIDDSECALIFTEEGNFRLVMKDRPKDANVTRGEMLAGGTFKLLQDVNFRESMVNTVIKGIKETKEKMKRSH